MTTAILTRSTQRAAIGRVGPCAVIESAHGTVLALDNHRLENHRLGHDMFDNHRLDNHRLDNHRLDNHRLGHSRLGHSRLGHNSRLSICLRQFFVQRDHNDRGTVGGHHITGKSRIRTQQCAQVVGG